MRNIFIVIDIMLNKIQLSNIVNLIINNEITKRPEQLR